MKEQLEQSGRIIASLRRHPRIVHQGFVAHDNQVERLRTSLPLLVPFGADGYRGFVPVLDWDHRLPSQTLVLRLFAYYTDKALTTGRTEYDARSQQIQSQDKFPEFDVPDYSGLPSDEAYEAEIDTNTGALVQLRLVSGWRREISYGEARTAVQVARKSPDFKELSGKMRRRPDYLGDLEAVSWTPPCESAHTGWTIDVWYLTDLDASVGKGCSFLVDLNAKCVVSIREFVVRSG